MGSVVSVRIYPEKIDLYLGTNCQCFLIATLDDGTEKDITEDAIWGVSDTSAEFDTNVQGLLVSKEMGEGFVYADYGVFSPPPISEFLIHAPLIRPQKRDLEGFYLPTIPYYLKFITSQYQNSPKLLTWLSGFLEIVQDIKHLSENLSFCFSFMKAFKEESDQYIPNFLALKPGEYSNTVIESAVGVQLDILGQILGVSRNLSFNPTDGSPPILEDNVYRVVLKNKVLRNHWDGTITMLQEEWEKLFPGGIIAVIDNQNMTIDVIITGSFSQILVDLIKNDYIIPRPQGVLMNYYIGMGNLPFFGFDRDDDFISGFDVGNWV